ncbi:tetratricopeptide repeat protein [Clostridium perfringens]|uniref:tetratricopeptide repeat protein n=1 Tax=Clostridium perfringens TaxID=1502 RepID=UPI0024BD05DF|nr:tetratricopeptide repeat protein [Clostridium perfringens]
MIMGCLSYIASSLIAPNLAGYFLSKKLTNREEKKLIEEITNKISEFNENYADTDVDSGHFVDFLKQDNNVNTIITRVFNAYKSSGEDYSELSKKLSNEAIEFINMKRDEVGGPHVKNRCDFESYFSDLFNALLNIRESLLSTKEKSMVSIIDESINRSGDKVVTTIKDMLGENSYLIEKKIEEIKSNIDKGLYEDAENIISEIFETTGEISKEQRVTLFYQKGRVYANTNRIKNLDEIRRKIECFSPNSKFIDEIDYLIGRDNEDEKLVLTAIKNLREKGEKEQNLILKESCFRLYTSDYEGVKKLILDENGEIKTDLKNEDSVYSQLGSICLCTGDFENAEKYFNKALELRDNISDEYHGIIAKSFRFIISISEKYLEIGDEIKEQAREICRDLERTYYFIKNRSKDIRLQHWCQYLSIIGIYDRDLAIEKFKEIDRDLINEHRVYATISEIYYFNKDYKNASKYLEYIWTEHSTFFIRMLNCCNYLDDWEKIEKMFEEDIEELFDEDGVVLFYKVQLLDKLGRLEDVEQLIINEGDKYKNSSLFVENMLVFLDNKKMNNIYETFIEYVVQLSNKIGLDERIYISRTLYNHKKYDILREFVSNYIELDDRVLELYLLSYDEVDIHNEKFDELKGVVKSFYKAGNRSRCLLQVKVKIELLTGRYDDAFDSLVEYKEKHGDDIFYKIYLVQCIPLGSLDNDGSNEAKRLLETNDLRNHIIASQYFACKGNWDYAKSLLTNAYYKNTEQIKEEELLGFLRLSFANIYQDRGEVEYNQIRDDSVAKIKDCDGNIINIGIHSNDEIVQENGEIKFECINFRSSSDYGLMLKAIGKKGSVIDFQEKKYTVLEILDIHTYLFRYFFNKMLEDYPNNNLLIPISGSTPEELIENLKPYLEESNKNIKERLDLYNFKTGFGTPISYLSGKNTDKYLNTIYFLLNNEDQYLYSTYSSNIEKGSKYVITLNSLVILNALGYLDKIKSISDRIFISSSIKSFVRTGIADAIKYDSVVSTAFLDEENKLRVEESSEESKIFMKSFWTQIMIAIKDFNEIKPVDFDTSYYDKMHEIIHISEFESSEIAANESAILVCDDLFISKISKGINNDISIINVIELLYKEEIISIDELIELLKNLIKKKYLNCINHFILFDIYNYLLDSYGTSKYEELYRQISDIFECLFGDHLEISNDFLYKNFIELVSVNNRMNQILYKLLEKPLNLEPYEERVAKIWNNLKLSFEFKE